MSDVTSICFCYAIRKLVDSNIFHLQNIAQRIRYHILVSTTEAGSGHPTSSLSATDLMTVLLYGGYFHFDIHNSAYHNNDRLIFSKGHASPLFYSMWVPSGAVTEQELFTLRKFDGRLEGHPTLAFPFTEAATGSLGQGLSVGVGMALNAKYVDTLPYRTFVLLGDSEMAEGSIWEATEIAAHYKLDNLIGILDVNRLGQRGETMLGYDVEKYAERVRAFGWNAVVIDGHNFEEISNAYALVVRGKDFLPSAPNGVEQKPTMIIAKTTKGKGVSFLEDKDGWHGKTLKKEELEKALHELGEVEKNVNGEIQKPEQAITAGDRPFHEGLDFQKVEYTKPTATRKAYGNALVRIFPQFQNIVVLDAEVSNSTFAETFKNKYPERFFEMFIAEQNMVGAALGFSRRKKIPFVSTFAAFFSRAFDQIRMSQYSDANIKFVGSHAGVSIGEDGASQMGLEDIAMFRAVHGSVVLYPSDAVAAEKLVEEAAQHNGIVYIRTTRMDTQILYKPSDEFPIGGSKTLRISKNDIATIVGAGVTVHEALAAYEELQKEKVAIRVIDLYSVKPLDVYTLIKAARETKAIITVEDHYPEGGIGEAVRSVLTDAAVPVYSLAVRAMPKSGTPEELLEYEKISKNAIIKMVRERIRT